MSTPLSPPAQKSLPRHLQDAASFLDSYASWLGSDQESREWVRESVYPWMSRFGPEGLQELAGELLLGLAGALRSGDTRQYETELLAWQCTGECFGDQRLVAALRAPLAARCQRRLIPPPTA